MSGPKTPPKVQSRFSTNWSRLHHEQLRPSNEYFVLRGDIHAWGFTYCQPDPFTAMATGEQFVVLGDNKLRGIHLQLSASRAPRATQLDVLAELEAARHVRDESELLAAEVMELLAEAKQLLSGIRTGSPALEAATEAQVNVAVDSARRAVEEVFGDAELVSVEVESVPDSEIEEEGASHRVVVTVRLPSEINPETLATAERDFFRSATAQLPEDVSRQAQILLSFVER